VLPREDARRRTMPTAPAVEAPQVDDEEDVLSDDEEVRPARIEAGRRTAARFSNTCAPHAARG
jgi:hypothetical protein